MAAGWIISRPPVSPRAALVQAAVLAAAGMAPDLDILIDRHRAESHSLGAALLVACAAALWRWPVADARWRIGCVIFAAWATHPLLDALSHDTKAPIGIMAFWPLSREYFILPVELFGSITRRWHGPLFLLYNGLAVARELAILAPVAAVVWWRRNLRRT